MKVHSLAVANVLQVVADAVLGMPISRCRVQGAC